MRGVQKMAQSDGRMRIDRATTCVVFVGSCIVALLPKVENGIKQSNEYPNNGSVGKGRILTMADSPLIEFPMHVRLTLLISPNPHSTNAATDIIYDR